jgi:hypothetical protein
LGVAKWGTILKSFYFSQFTLNKELVAKLIDESTFQSTKMTRKEWEKIASELKCNVPHAWYLVREEYLRY